MNNDQTLLLGRTNQNGAASTLGQYPGHRCAVPEKDHLLFPPRGGNRPTMRQVLSEPVFKSEFLGQTSLHAADRTAAQPENYHGGLEDIFRQLDVQNVIKRKEQKRDRENLKYQQKMQREQEAAIKGESTGAERAPWNYNEPMPYFEVPLKIERDESHTNTYNPNMQGIYGVKSNHFKPPHSEFDVFDCSGGKGWTPAKTNEREAKLDFIGANRPNNLTAEVHTEKVRWGEDRPRKLGPTETPFVDKLERKMKVAQKLITQDAMDATCGYIRKQKLEENADPFSALKRVQPPWNDSKDPKLGYFSNPEPYKPGEKPYTTGVEKYIQQSDRATSFEKDYVAGDGKRSSFWKQPGPGAIAGSTNMKAYAEQLTTPPGCKGILKWAGSKSAPGIDLDAVPGQLKKSVSGHLVKGSVGGTPCRKSCYSKQARAGAWAPPPSVGGSM